MSRAYIDDDGIAYVMAVKRHTKQLMRARGMTIEDLSYATGVPDSTMRRWLSTRSRSFMPLFAALRICQTLGVGISDMLIPTDVAGTDPVLQAFLALPPKLARAAVKSAYDMAAACGSPITPPADF